MDEIQQQQFQLFWHNRMKASNSQQQLLVDYDTFIHRFAAEIQKHTAIMLTPEQRLWIKSEIDPQNQNQVYKNAYLLFVKNFWSVPSNRTKFFNMKLNLSKLKVKPTLLEMAGSIVINIKYNEQVQQGVFKPVEIQYTIKKGKIQVVNSTVSGNIGPNQIQYEGFITVGSDAEKCNIIVDDPKINGEHLKIIYATNLEMPPGVKSTPSFPIDPSPYNRVYFRDISRSNRVKYCLDRQQKFLLLKKNMVIANLGYVEGLYQILITQVSVPSQADLSTFLNQANSDRTSYLPGVPDKPKKIIVNLDMDTLTENQIIDMLDRQLYYPEKVTASAKNKGKKDPNKSASEIPSSNKNQDVLPLKFIVRNLRTLEQTSFSSKSLKSLKIGRDKNQCDIIVQDIAIRPIQLFFQSINDIWFLKKQGVHSPELYISDEHSLQTFRNSNRIELDSQYPQKLKIGKNIDITITVIPQQKNKNDDNFL